MSKLALMGVTRRFGSVTAVDDFSLTLEEGEFVSLLGPSGCGKTTTLRMIAGFLDPTAGTIEMDGAVISSPAFSLPPERRGMSMIFQSYAIWPNMTVAENVAFGLQVRRVSRAELAPALRQLVHPPVEQRRQAHPVQPSGDEHPGCRRVYGRDLDLRPALRLTYPGRAGLGEASASIIRQTRDEGRHLGTRGRLP